ncbi:hypothetical protein ACFO3D_11625 [Virgibacillus kekensis]|uniref:Uncharacterized protein n=1 Tax=Virgibacillus kekensis TaxID=202261 RepID=A0ABV9DLI7_9BACI
MDIILILIAIIGAVAGFFKDKSDKDPGGQKRTINVPRPTPTPSGGAGRHYPVEETETSDTVTISKRQQEQRERLAERVNTATQVEMDNRKHDSSIGEVTKRSHTDLSKEQKQFKSQVKRNLSRKGLVNGIVMSEILGPPRAVKPYRSVIEQRRK